MKTTMTGLALMCLVASASALDKAELDNRLRTFTAKFEAMQQKADKRVPPEYLRKAQGIILLDRTKAGFLFAYQGGGGVALVKDPKKDKWSPAAFVSANEASLGFQVGGQQSFFVILLMDTNATHRLTDSTFKFSGEARGTAGDTTAGQEGEFSSTRGSVLVYADRKGLYGGAAIKGGAISPDAEANRIYYGQFLTMGDILFDKKVKPTETATALVKKVSELAKAAKE